MASIDYYTPEKMEVIPPGTLISKLFHPGPRSKKDSPCPRSAPTWIDCSKGSNQAMILALCRLIPAQESAHAWGTYGEIPPSLQQLPILVIVAGKPR